MGPFFRDFFPGDFFSGDVFYLLNEISVDVESIADYLKFIYKQIYKSVFKKVLLEL